MKYDQQYFIAMSAGSENYPLLTWDDDLIKYDYTEFSRREPIEVYDMLYLKLGRPIPHHPEMVDFHELPEPVFVKPLKNILHDLDINGIQLFEAQVRHGKTVYPDYYIMNVYHNIACLDKTRSKYDHKKYDDGVEFYFIDNLALDEAVLDTIPEKHRLIFGLTEDCQHILYHQKIVDAILAAKPKGISFARVDGWSVGSAFD